MNDKVSLIFVGSPLLDITIHCEAEFLNHYDLDADGCTLATPRHDALFDHLLHHPESLFDVGGSALNSARIAKWVAEDRGHISFAGCVGEDEYASHVSHGVQSFDVEPLLVTIPGTSTGTCACLLTSGGKHRSMCTRRGASALFQKDHLHGKIRERLSEADCVFVVGYFLSHSPDVVFELADMCRPNQIFSLSLSAEYVCRKFRNELLQVLPRVDVLMGNETELIALVETLHKCATVEDAASFIAGWKGSRIVVVSRGPKPVVLVKGTEVPRHFHVPKDVPVVDSVGCGDALAGAFLAIYALTRDLDRAVSVGIVAATETGRKPGCCPPSTTYTHLLKCQENISYE